VLDYVAKYEETSTTALSANPAVAVPLLTINGWILMMRKVTGGSLSFKQNWAEYRDGFGSAAGNDNYWLGLDKVYRLMQMGNVKLRVEVWKIEKNTCVDYNITRSWMICCMQPEERVSGAGWKAGKRRKAWSMSEARSRSSLEWEQS